MNTEQQQKVRDHLSSLAEIGAGVGNEAKHCSVAAINYALTGRVIDDTPDCASYAVCKWVIIIQDSIPTQIRNSPEWRDCVCLIPGTRDGRDGERIEIVMGFMWDCLSSIQAIADKYGYGAEWSEMLSKKTVPASDAASDAARAASYAARSARAASHAARSASDYFWLKHNPTSVFQKIVN